MKLFTQVIPEKIRSPFRLSDRIMLLGSCFAAEMGRKMEAAGFDVCINPFGTLYNPASLLEALRLLNARTEFTPDDCVMMGAGAGKYCSFMHHTSFARETPEEFLQHANSALKQARIFWSGCDGLILTLGTSMVWSREGKVVSNCLKRPAAEFSRTMLRTDEVRTALEGIVSLAGNRRMILTVSPIRHLGDGAHANSLSKARLLLASEGLKGCEYFPAYEILLDELRDYRFYGEDLVHPSALSVDIIWERFLDACTEAEDRERIRENEKAARSKAHRPMLK